MMDDLRAALGMDALDVLFLRDRALGAELRRHLAAVADRVACRVEVEGAADVRHFVAEEIAVAVRSC